MPTPNNKVRLEFWRLKISVISLIGLLLVVLGAQAEQASFTNLLAKAKALEQQDDIETALKFYHQAGELEASNAPNLCVLTRHYCDLMYAAPNKGQRKISAEEALACARQAVMIDPQNATAHVCLAVCYAKNFPYVDNRTKVNFSRGIKAEAEKAIALDPKQDVAYYLLGRWNYGVANMNFFYRGLVKIIYGGLPKASNAAAVENLKHAISIAPERIIHHAELAKVYAHAGQKNLALSELKICADLKPLDRDDADAQKEAIAELKGGEIPSRAVSLQH